MILLKEALKQICIVFLLGSSLVAQQRPKPARERIGGQAESRARARATAAQGDSMVQAAANGDRNAVLRYLSAGVAVDHETTLLGRSWTAAAAAASRCHPDMVKLLLDKGADVGTALFGALGYSMQGGCGNESDVEDMVEAAFSHAPVTASTLKFLKRRAEDKQFGYVRDQLNKAPFVEDKPVTDDDRFRFLWGLIENGSVAELLDTGHISPNRADASGETLLTHAARYANGTAIHELLARGADPALRDRNGRTAYDYVAAAADQQPRYKAIRDQLRMRHVQVWPNAHVQSYAHRSDGSLDVQNSTTISLFSNGLDLIAARHGGSGVVLSSADPIDATNVNGLVVRWSLHEQRGDTVPYHIPFKVGLNLYRKPDTLVYHAREALQLTKGSGRDRVFLMALPVAQAGNYRVDVYALSEEERSPDGVYTYSARVEGKLPVASREFSIVGASPTAPGWEKASPRMNADLMRGRWAGYVGSTAATLEFRAPGEAVLTIGSGGAGTAEEVLSVRSGADMVEIAGTSFRWLKKPSILNRLALPAGVSAFALDRIQAHVTPDGRTIVGTDVDANGNVAQCVFIRLP